MQEKQWMYGNFQKRNSQLPICHNAIDVFNSSTSYTVSVSSTTQHLGGKLKNVYGAVVHGRSLKRRLIFMDVSFGPHGSYGSPVLAVERNQLKAIAVFNSYTNLGVNIFQTRRPCCWNLIQTTRLLARKYIPLAITIINILWLLHLLYLLFFLYLIYLHLHTYTYTMEGL